MNSQEVSYDIEKAIDYAFAGKYVLHFYEYLKVKEVKKKEIDSFMSDSIAIKNLSYFINELDEYMKGGDDNEHKQLREAYKHISKPQARKIKNYFAKIIEDGVRYSYDKRPGRRKKDPK